MKLLSLLHVAAAMTAVGGVLVKKQAASSGLMIVRGNAADGSGAVCSPMTSPTHTDGLKISVRCCLMLAVTNDAGVFTETSQGQIPMTQYGGEAPGQDCDAWRGIQASEAEDVCEGAPQVGLSSPLGQLNYKLCPTAADATVQRGTGCLINQDWVWTNQGCTPA